MASSRGYFGRHWHGELSLGVSFWVNNILLAFPAGLAVGALMAWMTVTGDLLRSGSLAVLVTYPLLLLFDLWCIVGCWRAAGAYLEIGGSALWARLAQLLLALGALSTGYGALFEFAPSVPEYWRLSRGIDPIGNLSATLSADGHGLSLKGPIGAGDAVRVKQLVAGAQALRVVELDSPGGRLREAEVIADFVRGKRWRTRTTGACESACTLIHMAGSRRQVLPGAKLGFHRASAGTWNPVIENLANRELARIYREAGLPENFIQRTLATPPWRMWYPSRGELAGADLLYLPDRPLDLELPAGTSAPAAEYAELMQSSDAWLAIERRQPGVMQLAAQQMVQARASGADDTAVQVQAQRVVQALLPGLLTGSTPALYDTYLTLLIDQAGAALDAGGGPACMAVLRADAAARRELPAPLVQREASWLVDAAAEPQRDDTPRGLSALEQEVLARRLGDKGLALLARGWRANRGEAETRNPLLECRRTIELLRTVAALPAAERRLAARVIFERG